MIRVVRKRSTTGTTYEDGGDTRISSTAFFFVPDSKSDDFADMVASDCGYQDDGYRVSYETLMTLTEDELHEFLTAVKELKLSAYGLMARNQKAEGDDQ